MTNALSDRKTEKTILIRLKCLVISSVHHKSQILTFKERLFKKIYQSLKNFFKIYLAALGLRCGTWTLALQRVSSLAACSMPV